ncbi:isopentenyl-diphosphate delta-isomerase, type 2 [Rubidibacter lacunae KORDI 51-2]|uniref:Isopentenyl-diphosphate delta-isomerase n=1 Tax=Rubidibacter lacunae KORDI 51-2 TaxID=582515 RepID=U5DD56_9CHRO|nr:type 2 isopentenyl-diphosphate Delta-isomerase [Rubidibacter lacunae]ERN42448.1 isopentenyl-diphosphate delta-isomerase, type 2 [Rubidibacter lacunae KORDI 51-2]
MHDMQETTADRKSEHIDVVLQKDVRAKGITTGFERFSFDHVALPELNLDAIDLSCELWGRSLRSPLLIGSMTGGTESARTINLHLAEAAQELGIAMGVGSQRAAIEREDLAVTYQVRRVAPDILLFANLGAVQLNYGYGLDQARRAIDMLEADALFLHLNPLQEAVQPRGDRDWRNLYDKIAQLVHQLDVPVIAKEVGNGIDATTARRLAECGIAAIDVAGAGGTSWSEVEAYRQSDPLRRHVAHCFAGWGIPTALSLQLVRHAVPDLPVFASGGIRTGIDAAKAIALGAVLVGSAAPVLSAAIDRPQAVRDKFAAIAEELRIAAFCAGAGSLARLRNTPLRRTDTWESI